MSDIDLDAIEARANAATPGPWRWFGNVRNYQIYLATVKWGRKFVMQFDRWGMRDAQPTFQINDRMRTLAEMVLDGYVGRDHNDDITRIRHPDAEFIAAARTDIPALIARVREQEKEIARLTKLYNQACECGSGHARIAELEMDVREARRFVALFPPAFRLADYVVVPASGERGEFYLALYPQTAPTNHDSDA